MCVCVLTCFYCLSLPTKANIQVYVCTLVHESSAVFRCKFSTIISSIFYTVRRLLHLLKYLYTQCVLLVCMSVFFLSLSLLLTYVCVRVFSSFSLLVRILEVFAHVRDNIWYTCEWVHVCVNGYGSTSLSSSLFFLLYFFLFYFDPIKLFCHVQKYTIYMLNYWTIHNNTNINNLKMSCCTCNISYIKCL